MTEKERTNFNSFLYGAIGGIICVLLAFALTASREDKVATKDELKTKASIEYVDKKWSEQKEQVTNALNDIKTQQQITNQDIKEILMRIPRNEDK